MIKTRYWIIIIALILIVSIIFLFINRNGEPGDIVQIVQDDRVLYTIDLNSVDKEYDIRVEYGDSGYNIIHVCRGDIYIIDASCKGGDCIKRGHITSGGYPIICAPNRLTIRYTDSLYDGIAG